MFLSVNQFGKMCNHFLKIPCKNEKSYDLPYRKKDVTNHTLEMTPLMFTKNTIVTKLQNNQNKSEISANSSILHKNHTNTCSISPQNTNLSPTLCQSRSRTEFSIFSTFHDIPKSRRSHTQTLIGREDSPWPIGRQMRLLSAHL